MASGGEGGPAGGDLGIQSGLNQVQVPCQSYEWDGTGRKGAERDAPGRTGAQRGATGRKSNKT